MALEQYFQEAVAQQDSGEEDVALIEKWKPVPAAIDGCENNLSGGFDCNICLDLVQEPVVTLCGHLYCWPCIYKWIHSQSISPEIPDHQSPQCPVCKAEVSQGTLVPLYGRGKSSEGKSPHLGIVVPRRPPSPTCGTTRSRPSLQIPARSYPQWSEPVPSLDRTTDSLHPTVGMYGEMVYSRIFGSAENTSPDSYHLVGSNSPRVRRHIMQADKSLSRVCFFFSCCLVVCFLLF